MKRFTKRGLSLLLVLAMCVGLLTGLSFVSNAATVEYVYGSYEDFTDIIYNWGTRGVTATFLSPNAEDYYEAKGTSYEELAALAGSTDSDATDSALYAELKELMTDGMVNTSYGEARYLFPFTDCQNSNTSYISSFYDGAEYSNVWDAGKTYNREHVWPKSKLTNTSPSASTRADSSDLMMLRPVTANLNSSRGNKAYGEGEKYFNPNVSVGTTGYDIRGDVARTILYGYVFWNNTDNMWGENGAIESVEILLAWMEADPVDTWEMGRNDSVESINGCRNVFVDYPELAFELFEEDIPDDMATPSTGDSYNITAVSSNTAWGSVKTAGNVINAYAADGYTYAGYRVTSGTAKVTVQGSVLFVEASSDCVITIDFKARAGSVVEFMANGVPVDELDAYAGDKITLPDGTLAALDGYTFVGWVDQELTEETVDMPDCYSAGTQYTVNGNTTLYALFTRLGEGANASGTYELYSGALVEGDYLIVAENGTHAMKATTTENNGRFGFITVSATGNAIQTTDANVIWHIAPTGDGYYTFYNEATGKYAGGSGAKNKGAMLASVTDFAKWKVTADATPVITNLGNQNKGVNYTLRSNAENGYATYAATTGTAPVFYKAQTGVAYYTTGNAAVQKGDIEYWCEDRLVGTFATVEEAMSVATEGTILLTADATANSVIVKPGVTLDLNGNTLTANLLVAMNGAVVTDGGAACVGGGLLKVPQGNLALAKDNGGVVAVWNGADGYIFTKVTFQQMVSNASAGKAKYIFLPAFSNAEATALFADGALDNELSIKVCLSWNNGYSQQFYTYSDDLVMRVYDGTGRYAFDLTITGIAGITDMVASPVAVTNSGAQATTAGAAVTA